MKLMMKTTMCVVLLCGVMLAGGCAAYRPLQIEPIAKKGAVIQPKFGDAYYRYDEDGTMYVVARSTTVDKVTGQSVDQIFTARIFWRPVGGKTSMNKTSLNATYRYVLMSPNAVGVYEGAGFVRLWGKKGSKTIEARVMDGDLRLTEASVTFNDTIGRARMRGRILAKNDEAKALDMHLQAHRDLFARSLAINPAEKKVPVTGDLTTAPASTAPSPEK